MHTSEYDFGGYKPRKQIIRMDPDCAICHRPATMACDCEAKGLEVAVRQAEQRMMQSIYSDIRQWVRSHAQDYILEYFRLLGDRRKAAHTQHLEQITAHAYHYYRAPPHPDSIASAQAALKRGIDEDWQASVQRYPEVLEYFYSLVDLTLPSEDDPHVRDPPLSALNGSRKAGRRGIAGGGGGGGAPTTIGGFADARELPRGMTPPPPGLGRGDLDRLERIDARRTPGPRENRRSYRQAAPSAPPTAYFPPPPGY